MLLKLLSRLHVPPGSGTRRTTLCSPGSCHAEQSFSWPGLGFGCISFGLAVMPILAAFCTEYEGQNPVVKRRSEACFHFKQHSVEVDEPPKSQSTKWTDE